LGQIYTSKSLILIRVQHFLGFIHRSGLRHPLCTFSLTVPHSHRSEGLISNSQLCFVAYPIVFSEIRGWSSSITGLAFLGIGVGCLITIACEPLCRRIINSHPLDPETGKPYPEAMVSVVCVAAILIPTGEIIFAWTCTPNVHWIFPILAGVSHSKPPPAKPPSPCHTNPNISLQTPSH
jgi:hypothetical protein